MGLRIPGDRGPLNHAGCRFDMATSPSHFQPQSKPAACPTPRVRAHRLEQADAVAPRPHARHLEGGRGAASLAGHRRPWEHAVSWIHSHLSTFLRSTPCLQALLRAAMRALVHPAGACLCSWRSSTHTASHTHTHTHTAVPTPPHTHNLAHPATHAKSAHCTYPVRPAGLWVSCLPPTMVMTWRGTR